MDTEKKLNILLEFGKQVAKENDLDRLLLLMANFARNLLIADRCSIFLYDEKKEELWTKVAHGINNDIRINAHKGIAGNAALSQENQIIVDAYKDFRFNPDIDKTTGYHTTTILAVPLIDHNDKTIGVFQILNKLDGFFGQEDVELLQLISNYASASIENALLTYKLKQNQFKLINKLSTAAEFKDEDTSNHTKRVGEYAALIAKKLNLNNDDIELLRFTAPMHDAGKIGIADAILLKPGKLTDDEFVIMRTHTTIGYKLLSDDESDFLNTAATIAIDHHEKFDGSGYPNSKIGYDISLFGRIVALTDVFDALTSKRPYKEAWSIEKSLNLIKEEKGKHFDPDVVDVFLDSLDEIEIIYNKYKD